MGGNLLLKLNIDSRPIANKYREGKVKRTLERELKVSEIAEREANETSLLARDCRVRACFSTPQGSLQWVLRSVSFVNKSTSVGYSAITACSSFLRRGELRGACVEPYSD